VFSEVWAMGAPGGGEGAGSGNPLMAFLPLVIMFGILYFLLIRPQQKRQKEHKQMLESVKKGDRVVTSGGIHGSVVNVKDDVLTVKIANNVTIDINRSSVSRVK